MRGPVWPREAGADNAQRLGNHAQPPVERCERVCVSMKGCGVAVAAAVEAVSLVRVAAVEVVVAVVRACVRACVHACVCLRGG